MVRSAVTRHRARPSPAPRTSPPASFRGRIALIPDPHGRTRVSKGHVEGWNLAPYLCPTGPGSYGVPAFLIVFYVKFLISLTGYSNTSRLCWCKVGILSLGKGIPDLWQIRAAALVLPWRPFPVHNSAPFCVLWGWDVTLRPVISPYHYLVGPRHLPRRGPLSCRSLARIVSMMSPRRPSRRPRPSPVPSPRPSPPSGRGTAARPLPRCPPWPGGAWPVPGHACGRVLRASPRSPQHERKAPVR